ncbi:hypothetical protein [Bacillus thuringiensis]|uniref:hypothetical protein n=1 Tax=Bacillus thuringiensis TaxID=1428 RepID=UPI000B432C50|nr:hypothetical protein [Bacillus thuringiensis]MED1299959.1 hypothetical protein [Bacillus pacificus]OUA98543.1 hypothetical protein BK704_23405 [[Bacillus thuringiensis] serovar konkukian]PFV50405.1 hypothetical protein COL14_12595 [Bacillus thuringiensis]
MEDWFKDLHISSFIIGVLFLFLFLVLRKIITKVKPQNSPQELREWVEKKDLAYWLIIIILFAVSTYTYKYSSNEDVITHWGFAGTIVSIILAIIAIVYTFFDNFTSKSSHQKLEESADKIKDITKKLDSNSLVDSSNKIGEISVQLEFIMNNMDKKLKGINTELTSMKGMHAKNYSDFFTKLEGIGINGKNDNEDETPSSNDSTGEVSKFITTYTRGNLWYKLSVLCILLTSEKALPLPRDTQRRLSDTVSKITSEKDTARSHYHYLLMYMAFTHSINIFQLYGLSINEDKTLQLDPDLTELLEQYKNVITTSKKRSRIEKDVDKNAYEIASEALNTYINSLDE